MSTQLLHTPTKPSNLFGIDSLSAPAFSIQIARVIQNNTLNDTDFIMPHGDAIVATLKRYSEKSLLTLSRLLDSACSDARLIIESLEQNCPVEINFLAQGRTEYFPRVDLSTQEEIDTLTARIKQYEYIISAIDYISL